MPSNTSSISVFAIATNCPWKYPWSTLVVTVTSVVDAGILGSVVASVRVKLSIILESDRGPTILFSCTLVSNSPGSSIVGWYAENALAIFL